MTSDSIARPMATDGIDELRRSVGHAGLTRDASTRRRIHYGLPTWTAPVTRS
jgi:hypothetical protein